MLAQSNTLVLSSIHRQRHHSKIINLLCYYKIDDFCYDGKMVYGKKTGAITLLRFPESKKITYKKNIKKEIN